MWGVSSLDGFGMDDWAKLKEHFYSGESTAGSMFPERGPAFLKRLDDQFRLAKKFLRERVSLYAGLSMLSAWTFIIGSPDLASQIPDIIKIIHVYFIIVCHTSEVERGFSFHKILKTRLRNMLQIIVVDSLMRVHFLASKFIYGDHRNASLLVKAQEIANKQPLYKGATPPFILSELHKQVHGVQIELNGDYLADEGAVGEEPEGFADEEVVLVDEEEADDTDPMVEDEDDMPLAWFAARAAADAGEL